MMYFAHEIGRAALNPVRMMTGAQSKLLQHPLSPFSHVPGARSIASAYGVFGDLTRRYSKPAFNLHTTLCDGKQVDVREVITSRKSFAQLKHFQRNVERPDDPKLLIVAPLSGHFASLLRGTVEAMLPDHDVYITDWRDACQVPLSAGDFGLDDYIDYVIDFIDHLGPDTHVLAVCQPVVPVLAATAIMAEDGHPATPRSLTLMSGPIDGRVDPTTPCKLATKHKLSWFKRNLVHPVPAPYPGALRKVYPGFLQLAGFVNMNLNRHVDAYRGLFTSIRDGEAGKVSRHRDFYNEYLAVMDLPATYYLDTIQRVFQEFHLARGCFKHHGRLVNPAAIRDTALMTIEGEKDDISSPGQTRAAHDLCVNVPEARRLHHLQPGVGHYGVFNGSQWRETIAPRLRDFIRAA
ncbi:MAG TPA: polyhydroxyalkanoate depolymerase [Marinobacter sp.]|uniref:Polyhydroxyalkanoate depolymerase n=3 Tax=root TaxID=1 RepID=A0A831R677_9GAMM|nr:polyhydroxyalkanoate depolymerase [Marinobacter antarcticus]HDZ37430.1 polyhydroxyalkanoate depolymerase [Marinobacter sp.]HEA53543.1 polyhydroxyalkanoate depolymerase [Marinobacter antarcticus]